MYEFYTNIMRQLAEKSINIQGFIQGDINRLLDSQRMDQPYPVLFSDDPVLRITAGDSAKINYDCTIMILDTVASGDYDHQEQILSNLSNVAKEIAIAATIELYNFGVDAVGNITIDPIRENTPDNLIGWGINFQFSTQTMVCLDERFWEGTINPKSPFSFTAQVNDLSNLTINTYNVPPNSTISWKYQLDGLDTIDGNPESNNTPANTMLIQANLVDNEGKNQYATLYLRNQKGYLSSVPGKILP